MSALSLQKFITAVIRTRDILRTKASITGMDSMRHICLYLMSRFITRELAGELGVPPAFAWESLIETLRGSAGEEKAMESFCHSSADCLVSHFDRLFGTSKFPFDLKPENKHHRVAHKEILEAMNDVNMMEVDFAVDILGWVYEQHLKTGSSSASRDLGQYFTDRALCNYMVRLCRPGFKYPGVPESICDPTMGTAGFLTAAIKYYKRAYPDTPVDWRAQLKQIHGCDTDDRVAGVARLNIFMETHGCRPEHLLTHNSLFDDLPQMLYDIILANMPFGLKGLKFKDCCERVKSLKLDGTKSEPLFLQLMMVSLAPGGRCAVVVPDGLLVNSSKCHNGTRKYLLDNFELKKVIKMEGSFFMNTSIKPSVLFFENTGKPTTEVEFWKVTKTEGSELDEEEELLVSVPREKFGEDFSLDLRRYLDAEKPAANPSGFPMVKLGDIADVENGKILSMETIRSSPGEYPIISGGREYCGNYREFNRMPGTITVSKTGSSSGFVKFHTTKFWAADCFSLKFKDEFVHPKFVYYSLSLKQEYIYKNYQRAGVMPHCYWSDFQSFSFNLPPRAIQDEIVATLDRIYAPGTTELTDTLKMTDCAMDLVLASPSGTTLEPIVEAQRLIRKSAQMVADVKAQMVAIVKSVGGRGFAQKKLSEVCDISKGKRCLEAVSAGGYPYQDVAKISRMVAKYILDTPAVLTPRAMSIGRFVYVDEKCHPSDDMFIMNPKDGLHVKYLYYYCTLLLSAHFRESLHGVKPTIDYSVFDYTNITIPPLAFQEAVLTRLEALQSRLTALESLQKDSEENARFILESYLGAPAAGEEISAPVTAIGGAGTGPAPDEEDDSSDHSVISHA